MAGYAKLFGSIVRSTVWVGTSPETKVVWVTLLALSDRDGIVESSIPGLMVTTGVSREAVEAALECFMSPDPDSRTPDHDGRRIEKVAGGWRLLNYEKYCELQSASDVRSKGAERAKRYRDRHGSNADRNVTSRPVTLAAQTVTSAQAQAHAHADPADQSDPPRRSVTQEIEPVTIADRPTDVWPARRWLSKFKAAWEARGVPGTAFYSDTGDGKACETLAVELERLPLALRLLTQGEAQRMFAAFFSGADAKTRHRNCPFIFFVQEFGSLRQRASQQPAGKPLPPSTVDLRR